MRRHHPGLAVCPQRSITVRPIRWIRSAEILATAGLENSRVDLGSHRRHQRKRMDLRRELTAAGLWSCCCSFSCGSRREAAVRGPCCRCHLFASKSFVGLNSVHVSSFTARWGGLLVLLPFVLIKAGGYSAAAASAALLPLPLILTVSTSRRGRRAESLVGSGRRRPLAHQVRWSSRRDSLIALRMDSNAKAIGPRVLPVDDCGRCAWHECGGCAPYDRSADLGGSRAYRLGIRAQQCRCADRSAAWWPRGAARVRSGGRRRAALAGISRLQWASPRSYAYAASLSAFRLLDRNRPARTN